MPLGIRPPGLVHPSLPPRQSPAPGVGYDYGAELGNCAGGSFPRKNGQRYRLHLVSHQLGCSLVGRSFASWVMGPIDWACFHARLRYRTP